MPSHRANQQDRLRNAFGDLPRDRLAPIAGRSLLEHGG
jgi:hypothetical protein